MSIQSFGIKIVHYKIQFFVYVIKKKSNEKPLQIHDNHYFFI